jgi:hypothetical protein
MLLETSFMNTSKLLISGVAGFSIIALNALSSSASLAGRLKPFSATGGAHGAGVLVLKTNSSNPANPDLSSSSNLEKPELSSRGPHGGAVIVGGKKEVPVQ